MWILAGVCWLWATFTAPEMANDSAPTREDIVSIHVGIFGTDVVACVLSTRIGIELQIAPTTLLAVLEDPLDR